MMMQVWRHQNTWVTVEFLERETGIDFVTTVASKLARFKSGWLQRVQHTAREGVQNMHHWSRWPQTSYQNRVGRAGSYCHCCSYDSVALSSFSLRRGGRWSFWALLLLLTLCFRNNWPISLKWQVELNSCRLIFRSYFLAVISYGIVRFNTYMTTV